LFLADQIAPIKSVHGRVHRKDVIANATQMTTSKWLRRKTISAGDLTSRRLLAGRLDRRRRSLLLVTGSDYPSSDYS